MSQKKVKVKGGGPKAAAELLNQLSKDSSSKIMDYIEKKDQDLAKKIKSNLFDIENLKYLDVKLIISVLRELPPNELGHALLKGSENVRLHILKNVSTNIKTELEEVFESKTINKQLVIDSFEKLKTIISNKENSGEINFSILKNDEIIE